MKKYNEIKIGVLVILITNMVMLAIPSYIASFDVLFLKTPEKIEAMVEQFKSIDADKAQAASVSLLYYWESSITLLDHIYQATMKAIYIMAGFNVFSTTMLLLTIKKISNQSSEPT